MRSEESKKQQKEYLKNETVMIGVRFCNPSGIPQALDACLKDKGVTKGNYAYSAIVNQLISDGYNPEDYKPKK